MKTVPLFIEEELLAQVDQVVEQEKTTLSALIKDSLITVSLPDEIYKHFFESTRLRNDRRK